MANRWAVANGNWSATATWNGGTLPTAADDVFANNFTVTVDQNVTALSLRTEAAAGINAGGGFTLAGSFNITADLYAGTSSCVTFSANSPNVTAITGNLFGGTSSGNNTRAFNHTGTGTSTINGNLTGSTSTGGAVGKVAARIAASGSMFINGNITGGGGTSSNAGLLVEAGSVEVTGNASATTAVAITTTGGSLNITGNLNCSTLAGAVVISAASSNVTINGNQTFPNLGQGAILSAATSGNYVINGSLTHNGTLSSVSQSVVSLTGTSNLTVNGALTNNVSGNTGNTVLSSSSIGAVNITGNVIRSGIGAAISFTGNGSLTITGDISTTSNTLANCIEFTSGTLTINGNITGVPNGTTTQANLRLRGLVNATINGNVTGGTVANSNAIVTDSTTIFIGTLTINGTVTAGTGSNADAIQHLGSGTVVATRVVGNGYGVGSTGIAEAYAIDSLGSSLIGEIIVQEYDFGLRGAPPIRGNCRIANSSSRVSRFRDSSGTQISLVDPSTLVTPPAVTDVRSGVVYNNGNLTGTLAVPPVNQVAAGIAVDNTVGTAALTQASVWDYALSSASSVAGSVGEKLKKTAIPADIIALG